MSAHPKNPFSHPMVKLSGGKFVESFVYNLKTGERLLRAPVDAKELVKTGEWSFDPVEVKPEEPSEPAAEPKPEPKRSPGRPRNPDAA